MDKYILQGKLYYPRLSKPLEFEGSFVRNINGTLGGRMEFDERSPDMRDEIYGSLTNEDRLSVPHDGRAAEDCMALFHTRNGLHIDRVYWLARTAKQGNSFEGVYKGIKECVNPYRVQDVRDVFGWNIPEILSETNGPEVEIILTKL